MSSNTTPVSKRTRSSGKSTTTRTQSLRPSTADKPQSPPDDLAPRPAASDEPQQEGTGPIGPPEPSTKNEMVPEAQDTDEALDTTSAHEGVLPHATVADKDEGGGKVNTTAPLSGTETNNHTGNEDTTKKASNPQDPTLEKSWEVIMKEVTALDEGPVGGWKEDIDTLLVFAGLFSAVVTAFVIESYQWLQEAPEDTTVALLKQISQQLNNTSEPVPEPDTFTVSSSVVAINVLWFLSLIIALVDALFALLCKQWLREHRRHTHTRTPSEALALRWLRKQSLEKWHVPAILASLPMLLEIALFLFLAGLLELLRTRHPFLFKVATIVVALAALFYFATTIIPAIDIIRQALQVTPDLRKMRARTGIHSPVDFITTLPSMEFICPYKSPQAWLVIQSLRFTISHILRLLEYLKYLRSWFLSLLQKLGIQFGSYQWGSSLYFWACSADRDSSTLFKLASTCREIITSLTNWSSVDLELLQRSNINLAPPFYELDAFRWLVAELRDSPHMIPHLRNILSTFPLHLVMPAVLDQWFFLPGRKWAVSDIEAALDPNLSHRGIGGHLTRAKRQFLTNERQSRHFRRLLHWTHVSMNGGNESGRDSPSPFSTPFKSIDANPDVYLRDRLWNIYTEIVESPGAPKYCLAAFVGDLAMYIIASSPDYALHLPTATTTSLFVESATGRKFLSDVHSTILERAIYRYTSHKDDFNWTEAMDIVRRVHELPVDHFGVIPGYLSLPLPKLKKTLNNLSPTDTGIDFGYLDLFRRGWGDAHRSIKEEFVKILSEHINHYPQSDTELSHRPDKSKISPLVMSSAGLELITFVNNRLAEERDIWYFLWNDNRKGWRDAIERVRAARPKLPPDHFQHIFHGAPGDPPAPAQRSSQQEAKVEAQAEDSSGNPRDVENTGEVDRDEQTEGRSEVRPSPQPKPGELDEQGPLVDNAGQRSIPRRLVVTGNLASGSASGPTQGTAVGGGPDANNYKNV
ncbi:hypothetical protein PQX77_001441 [Marasmius sp. AFHP31]|nr:hypothetical protein PQX77_001441 [Marasmius sp. AFHP31]